MSIKNKTLTQFSNIFLSYGDNVVMNKISGSVTSQDRIGLVGINGSGKSSLLKIIAGIIKPNSGTVSQDCSVEYVPQLDMDLYKKRTPLYKHIEKIYPDWWQVLLKYEHLFGDKLQENRKISTLSGGELVKLNLVIALNKNPDLLLLDEPTNHLDLSSLKKLEKALIDSGKAFIIVSHNVDFLNKVVSTIWELDKGSLYVYGGNYDFYKEEKERKLAAEEQKYFDTVKQYKKEQRSLQTEQKRAAVSNKVSEKKNLPPIVAGNWKRWAEMTASQNRKKIEERIQKKRDELEKKKPVHRKNVYLDLQSQLRKGLIVTIEKGTLSISKEIILIQNIDLEIHHGDRIAILGDNGTGKTTLVKQLEFQKTTDTCTVELTGDIKYGSEYKTLYVDQKYDLVDPNLSIVQNIKKNNPKLPMENTRRVLGNLGFPTDYDINKSASFLSGGEIARLAFAIATNSEIDLLVLDEPTNNLDIETVEVIAEALSRFIGTIVAISHDMHFLEKIGIENYYVIEGKRLVKKAEDEI